MNKITFYLLNLSTGGASQALPPTSPLSVKRFKQQKSTAWAVLKWLSLPRLNQRHREPCHASSCGSRLFLLVFSQKADRCAKPCSLLPPPAAHHRLCQRLRSSVSSISGNKKALRLQCINVPLLPNRSAAFAQKFAHRTNMRQFCVRRHAGGSPCPA